MILAGPAMTSYAKPDWPADTGIQSEAGIVMDMDSKTVIFGQNIHVQKAPASITKLLTALVVIENANLDDMVTFSDDAYPQRGRGRRQQECAGAGGQDDSERLPLSHAAHFVQPVG